MSDNSKLAIGIGILGLSGAVIYAATKGKKEDEEPPPPNTHSLIVKIKPTGAGTVTKKPNLAAYPDGSLVVLTAIPGYYYIFTRWILNDEIASYDNTMTLAMLGDEIVTAEFDAYYLYHKDDIHKWDTNIK